MEMTEAERVCGQLSSSLAQAVPLTAGFIWEDEHGFRITVDQQYRKSFRRAAQRNLAVLKKLLQSQKDDGSLDELFESLSGKLLRRPKKEDSSVDELFESVSELTDDALEAALTNLGEVPDSVAGAEKEPPQKREPRPSMESIDDMPKPQLLFKDWPIDNSDTPFIPPSDGDAPFSPEFQRHVIGLSINNDSVDAPHPFRGEILAAAAERAADPAGAIKPVLYRSMEETPFTFVDSEELLSEALDKLSRAKEIAVDLENHSHRSFQGFCCLMQVSTREEDFVIDAIQMRTQLRRLKAIFADPNIVKVFHGARSDMQWLERDFGVYVVDMFDTGEAARLLELPKRSLGYLLEMFCDVDSSGKKAYQLADWRQRPLPDGMLSYARSDTHYLLYIYDRLRHLLGEKDLLGECWHRSAQVSLVRYEKPRYDPEGHMKLIRKMGLKIPASAERVLEELLRWRDAVARREDESTGYVLPNRLIAALARTRETARSGDAVLNVCGRQASPLVLRDREKLAQLIADASDANVATPQSRTVEPVAPTANSQRQVAEARPARARPAEEAAAPAVTVKRAVHSVFDSGDESDLEAPGSDGSEPAATSGRAELQSGKPEPGGVEAPAQVTPAPATGGPTSVRAVREEIHAELSRRRDLFVVAEKPDQADGAEDEAEAAQARKGAVPAGEDMIRLSDLRTPGSPKRKRRKRTEVPGEGEAGEDAQPAGHEGAPGAALKLGPQAQGHREFDYEAAPWSLQPREQAGADSFRAQAPLEPTFARKRGRGRGFGGGGSRRASGSKTLSYRT